MQKYDGKRRMSTPHGCFWSCRRVSTYASETGIIFFSFCNVLLTFIFFLCSFTVEADKSIKDLTIVTEYVGDVDFLKNREYDDGDSIMTLLFASDPSQSLVICPDKRSNIARFVNGINNHTLYVPFLNFILCIWLRVGKLLLIGLNNGSRVIYRALLNLISLLFLKWI